MRQIMIDVNTLVKGDKFILENKSGKHWIIMDINSNATGELADIPSLVPINQYIPSEFKTLKDGAVIEFISLEKFIVSAQDENINIQLIFENKKLVLVYLGFIIDTFLSDWKKVD